MCSCWLTPSPASLVKYNCCDKIFTTKELYDHVAADHVSQLEMPVLCEECNYVFASFEIYMNHFKPRSNICVKIRRNIRNRIYRNIRRNIRRNLHRDVHNCRLCSFEIEDEYKLRAHVFHIHGSVFGCGYCTNWFYTLTELQEHKESKCRVEIIRSDIDDYAKYIDLNNKLTCIECKKTFDNSTSLNNHIGRMHKHKNFRCKQCGGTFCSIISVKQHFRNNICGIDEKTHMKGHQCPRCLSMFRSMLSRDRHTTANKCSLVAPK